MTNPKHGYTGKMRGVPIAIEKHGDGSITLCKEVIEDILNDLRVPNWIKELLI